MDFISELFDHRDNILVWSVIVAGTIGYWFFEGRK